MNVVEKDEQDEAVDMTNLVLVLLCWVALSVPSAMVAGRMLRNGGDSGAADRSDKILALDVSSE